MNKLSDNNLRVAQAYRESGLTYDKLAEFLKIPRNTLACYITGRRTPSDIVTAYITDKVKGFLEAENSNITDKFINKTQTKDSFVKQIENACLTIEQEDIKAEVQDKIKTAFDELPVLSAEQVSIIYKQNLDG